MKLASIAQRSTSARQIRGQGMTEYIIIVALIAVAAIGTYSLFGKTVRSQSAGMAAALGGDSANAKLANAEALKKGGEAWTEAKTAKGLDNFTDGSDKK